MASALVSPETIPSVTGSSRTGPELCTRRDIALVEDVAGGSLEALVTRDVVVRIFYGGATSDLAQVSARLRTSRTSVASQLVAWHDYRTMRILVTGHRGCVGAPVAAHLQRLGHDVVGFDRADGSDLLDAAAVRRAADGCDVIVHLGAIPRDECGSPEDIMAVNVLGTWHVLLAAEAARTGRVIHFSSVAVFGIFKGELLPDYFPVDDAHPRRATRPYGLSKCLAEDLCAAFTIRTGIPTMALRPVWVWDPGMYQRIEERWREDPRSEWLDPEWEFGDFVDVRDVATAVQQALTVPLTGHHRVLLCAADIAATQPGLGIAARVAPAVPIRDRVLFQHEPWRALFDCSAAARLLDWQPRCTWADRGPGPWPA